MEPRYIVISPVRNEAEFLPGTIESMAAQSVVATRWIIVDDGSSDHTGKIAEEASVKYPWIEVVHRKDRGFRQAGGGVIDAFYAGYERIGATPWDFLVKMDGDVSFDSDYFPACLREFERRPRLGVGGGTVCCLRDGVLKPESEVDPRFHVRGATKIYKRECWDAIGGLIRAPGWDTLDEVKANMLGWETGTFANIRLHHHRPAGAAYGSWSNWTKNGLANYKVGYHPLFMIVKSLRRMFSRPYLLMGTGLLVGFFSGYLRRVPQADDPAVIRYFRRQQMNRLLGRPSLWDL